VEKISPHVWDIKCECTKYENFKIVL